MTNIVGHRCDPLDLVPLRDTAELERLAVFAVCVAGKGAPVIWRKVEQFIPRGTQNPFELLHHYVTTNTLISRLYDVRMGQYTRIGRALTCMAALHATPWRPADLYHIGGVNFKTAKLVELYKWPGGECACLDVHVLREMATWPTAAHLKIPKASPQNFKVYTQLEELFIREAYRRQVVPWVLDKEIWLKRAKGVT